VIEDQQEMVEVLALATEMRWPGVGFVTTRWGEKGVELAGTEAPDLIILDLGLPDTSGFEVLRRIRLFSDVPVIILSVRADPSDILKGLQLGADDYIVKPFRHQELLGRIDALTSHSYREAARPRLSCGRLYLDLPNRLLQRGGEAVPISATEADILHELARNAGYLVDSSSLAQAVWGEHYPGADESLQIYIKRLHAKIEADPGNPPLISNKPGVGYSMLDNAVTL